MNATRISLAAATVTLALALTGCAGLADALPRESHTMAAREQEPNGGDGTDGAASLDDAPSGGAAAEDDATDEDGAADAEAADDATDAEAADDATDAGDATNSDAAGDAAASPSGEPGASDGQAAPDSPADPVTIRMTWPDEWLEQPADSLPPGSIAMARTLPDAAVAAATVVAYDADGAASDMPALLEGRGADPASITTGEPRDVAGDPTERWEARSASGELDMVAYPVPMPSGGTSLVTFVVTAGQLAQIEADIAAVLDSYELG